MTIRLDDHRNELDDLLDARDEAIVALRRLQQQAFRYEDPDDELAEELDVSLDELEAFIHRTRLVLIGFLTASSDDLKPGKPQPECPACGAAPIDVNEDGAPIYCDKCEERLVRDGGRLVTYEEYRNG